MIECPVILMYLLGLLHKAIGVSPPRDFVIIQLQELLGGGCIIGSYLIYNTLHPSYLDRLALGTLMSYEIF